MSEKLKEQFLCRAKRVDTGEWAIGFYYQQRVMGCIGPPPEPLHFLIVEDPHAFADWHMAVPVSTVPIDPATICRCTGQNPNAGEYLFEAPGWGW